MPCPDIYVGGQIRPKAWALAQTPTVYLAKASLCLYFKPRPEGRGYSTASFA